MAQRWDSPTASSPQCSFTHVIDAAIPSTIMSCRKRHSCFIASHRAFACSRSPASIASIARSIVGRDISVSSLSENQRSAISPPLEVIARAVLSSMTRRGRPCQPEALESRAVDTEATAQAELHGEVSEDLRDLLAANGGGSQPLGEYSRIYCDNGSLEACRAALQTSLSQALSVTPAQIYGQGACAEDPQ